MRTINTEKVPIKLWLDDIEPGALEQAKNLANLPFVYRWIAIMPDCHQGFGMPIGAVMATRGAIVPNAVGVDIGCGVMAVKTDLQSITTAEVTAILDIIRSMVPVGFSHNKQSQAWEGFDAAPPIRVIQEELPSASKQIGTLGGGNHFIEIQQGDDGYIWLMLHSGSRNFGLKVANDFHKKAVRFCEKHHPGQQPKDLSWLPDDSEEGMDYYEAMNFCLQFAWGNRELMMEKVKSAAFDVCKNGFLDTVHIHHNYAAYETHYGNEVLVHRKGATRAGKGERGIIPGSMGTQSYIVLGRGNPESFMSCSHGAGRRMGRKHAQRTLSLEMEKKKMKGIVHRLRSQKDLDEAPGAYKDINTVMENQKDLVDVLVQLTPLGVIKG